MSVTVTNLSKSPTVSVTLTQKNAGTSIAVGESIGLLLALTYADSQSSGGLNVSLISKS